VITPDLQPLAVPVKKLKPAQSNARRGDVDAIKKSYERFGQRKPIVVSRKTDEIIAGNHQFEAALQLGWTEIAVVFVDDDDKTRTAYSIADNRIGQLGEWDLTALIEAFDSVDASELEIAGFTEIDVEDFRALAEEGLIAAPAAEVTGEGAGRGETTGSRGQEVSVDDFLERYAARETRGIILYYTAGEYDKMVKGLDDLGRRFGLDDNAAVVQKLVEDVI
jgi:ParB-like chromosome segregation protein Spo0J